MITSLAFASPIYIEQESGSESQGPSKKETAATIAEQHEIESDSLSEDSVSDDEDPDDRIEEKAEYDQIKEEQKAQEENSPQKDEKMNVVQLKETAIETYE